MNHPATKESVQAAFSHLESRPVSQWSKFGDSVWVLSTKNTIRWKHIPKQHPDVDQSAFDRLMEPVKRLTYLLLTEEGLKPPTISGVVWVLKALASWMLSRPVALTHFSDLNKLTIKDYLEYLSNRSALTRRRNTTGGECKTLEPRSIQRSVSALQRLYDYRSRLEDALHVMPQELCLNDSSSRYQRGGTSELKTQLIPDEDHQILLRAAVNYIDEKAAGIIARLKAFIKDEKIIEIRKALNGMPSCETDYKRLRRIAEKLGTIIHAFKGEQEGLRQGTQLSVITLARQAGVPLNLCIACLSIDSDLKNLFRAKRRCLGDNINWDTGELNKDIRLLQAACFIVIATSTGMRLSELLAIKPKCIVKRKIKGYEELIYWIKSQLFKTSTSSNGEIAFWLCGELAANAVNTLEQLHSLLPTTLTQKNRKTILLSDCLFRAYSWNAVLLEARPILRDGVQGCYLDFFIKELHLDIRYFHPHQFRRTFARNVIRWTGAPILALQRHFKHWSLLMTDYYIGIDYQLIEMYLDEQKKASEERLRQILKGECGGPGGLISQKRLAKVVDHEELPKNFRGKEHAGTIETLLVDLREEGLTAYKCGEFTTCLYVPGSAKCGEGGPKEHECHPTECANSHILVEDVPFYLNNIRQNLSAYEQLSELNKAGPAGLFLLERLRRDKIAIQPLVALYAEKLRQLQSHYEQLSESEKKGSYGSILINRIERDRATLRTIL